MSNNYEAPPKRITVGGIEVSMPYAKLMDLSRMLPDPASALSLVMNDSVTQDYIVRRALTPVDRVVKSEEDLISDTEVDLETDDVEKLLTWVVQHILYFFVKRTQGLAKVGDEFKAALPSLSTTGSES